MEDILSVRPVYHVEIFYSTWPDVKLFFIVLYQPLKWLAIVFLSAKADELFAFLFVLISNYLPISCSQPLTLLIIQMLGK